jgi:hypothetical protein
VQASSYMLHASLVSAAATHRLNHIAGFITAHQIKKELVLTSLGQQPASLHVVLSHVQDEFLLQQLDLNNNISLSCQPCT